MTHPRFIPVRTNLCALTTSEKNILEDYLADRMAASKDVSRRGIGIQFIVDGFKDGIDYDLSTPEFIKQWENWGGSDSIVVSLPKQRQ